MLRAWLGLFMVAVVASAAVASNSEATVGSASQSRATCMLEMTSVLTPL